MAIPVVAVFQHKYVKVGADPGLKVEPDSPKIESDKKNGAASFGAAPCSSFHPRRFNTPALEAWVEVSPRGGP